MQRRKEVEHLDCILNFIEFCILELWKFCVWAKILKSVLGRLREKHAVQRAICVSTPQLLKNLGNSRKSLINLDGRMTFRVHIDF